ncbi:hypothetical protein FB451DRAFT_1183602 [Mycena latifolia]|nr:hypothetical protein FB451DRAFT_1183602 [Mycena latifolia]
MRFYLISLAIVALAGVSHAAVIPGLAARHGSSAGASGSSDVCACISGAVKVSGTDYGSLSTSTTLAPLTAGLEIGGKVGLIASLTGMINASSGKKTCTYPANSIPACSSKNLCGYSCNSGFIASGLLCLAADLVGEVGAVVSGTLSRTLSGGIHI